MTQIVKIGNISTQIRGVSYSKSDVIANMQDGYLPVLRANNIQEQGLVLDDFVYVPESKISEKQRILAGDVIIAASSGSISLVGKAASAKEDINAGFGAFCKILRPNTELVDPRYFANYFQTQKYRQIISNLAAGANINNLKNEHLDDLEIPLPPLAEQRRIASILDQADELRQKRQQAIEKLDQLLQATFIDMFGDPVSNPKGWERVSAKNVLKIQGGFAFSSTDFSKSGIPVVKIGNANKLGFSTEKFDFIIPQYPEKLTQYELRSGDLLMSLTGTVGKDDYGNITEVTDDYDLYYLNQRVAKLEVTNTLFSKNYIRYFFSQSSIKALITKNNRGVRQANISNSDLYELDIPLPTKAQLDKFDSFIESINETKRYSKVQLISSNKLFFALQNQAFNGTL
ncbi:restriction endonuclease subunit S [Acinetobacter indicus]|uniref:restriction endonuclease subunit S n=2 Tax=Acinetobacter TaxID=469 RepID=UPI0014443493|nr:restriction endonuclease subunit S [Acinetobacter indicus]